MGYLFVTEEGVTDHSITAVDILSEKQRVVHGINHP